MRGATAAHHRRHGLEVFRRVQTPPRDLGARPAHVEHPAVGHRLRPPR